MKRAKRFFFSLGCIILLAVSWAVVLGAKSDGDIQSSLMAQAKGYIDDEVYILAVPLLEEAAGYETALTAEAEAVLKDAYLKLIGQREYKNRYFALLEKQMARENVDAGVFIEAADYQLENKGYPEYLALLKTGAERTGSSDLAALYEENRYQFQIGRSAYENVTAICNDTIGVQRNGLWGLASSGGSLLISCQYEKLSTYSGGRLIVHKDGVTTAVDSGNQRLSVMKETGITDFGNYNEGLTAFLTDKGWVRGNSSFGLGSTVYEALGTYSSGYAAAKKDGKWGVIDADGDWFIPAEYDGIVMDELGRACAQDAVFVKKGDSVQLLVNGEQIGKSFQDARPFHSGYAAVKQNGKWGFINTAGETVIDAQFEDALSFGQHLAAVQKDGLWGYISKSGTLVIEPEFLQAKSFSNYSAPVLTDLGWQFISLLEYKKGVGF